MIKLYTIPPKLSAKLYSKYIGPFKIIAQIDNLHYKLHAVDKSIKKKIITVHVDRMKPYGTSTTSTASDDDEIPTPPAADTTIINNNPNITTTQITAPTLVKSTSATRPSNRKTTIKIKPALTQPTVIFQSRSGRTKGKPATYRY